jgi:lipoprotein-anchoring transpeptidase ErfK/SrfK
MSVSKHRASHRIARRRGRAGVLGVALGVALGLTIAAGAAAVGVLPQLEADRASADTSVLAPAAIETATIDPVVIPEPEPQRRAAAASVTPVAELPAASGTGRRIVFDQSDQRVWLVDGDGVVERTYLVSGSRFNNLQPGSYAVQSKSRQAGAFDGSGSMEYFVRFATGFSEPIGFHSVPKDNSGRLEQTKAQLGTELSAGCVRQWLPDAIALWDFAPVGTKVVVTA